MRLTCPRCGAQYEIDPAAIAPAGREVGCSACGHTWRAFSAAPPFDPAARPALSRPLSDSVLDILREEAARELNARAAERGDFDGPVPSGAPREDSGRTGQARERENGGPARDGTFDGTFAPTTHEAPGPDPRAPSVHEGRPARIADSAAKAAQDRPGRAADSLRPLPGADPAAPPPGAAVPAAPPPVSEAAPRTASASRRHPVHDAPPPASPEARARRGYDLGFGVAIAAALAALALYALAPRLADQGAAGAQLMEWRARIDQGRSALAGGAERLLEGAPLVRRAPGD